MFKSMKTTGLLIAGAFSLTACATAPDKQFQDPFESTNRGIYKFNEGLDKVLLKPAGQAYAFLLPDLIAGSSVLMVYFSTGPVVFQNIT